jgi:hypothetical protein
MSCQEAAVQYFTANSPSSMKYDATQAITTGRSAGNTMSNRHFVKAAVSNALRVFLFLAMAHPAMASDADAKRAEMEQPAMAPSAPSTPTTLDTIPGSAPIGFGWG